MLLTFKLERKIWLVVQTQRVVVVVRFETTRTFIFRQRRPSSRTILSAGALLGMSEAQKGVVSAWVDLFDSVCHADLLNCLAGSDSQQSTPKLTKEVLLHAHSYTV